MREMTINFADCSETFFETTLTRLSLCGGERVRLFSDISLLGNLLMNIFTVFVFTYELYR